MEFEQYFGKEWKTVSSPSSKSESFGGSFDCNICFDFACEPVVTLCGHLYCWPCIYKWLHVQSTSLTSNEHAQCPICKADISHSTMVPLYGRGQSETEVEGKAPFKASTIPPRPSASGTQAFVSATNASVTGQRLRYRNPYQDSNLYGSFGDATSSPPPITNIHHPFFGVFGEMVYARVFGNSESLYVYPNSYHQMGSTNPRLRRQEMQANKSLDRISVFLLCCFLLCLIVF